MNIAVCYVHPNLKPALHVPAAKRFVASYLNHPPGECDHDLWVLVNNGPLSDAQKRRLFDPLAVQYFAHDNTGKDIGAYQHFAQAGLAYDLMICLGAFVHFNWTGWLDRIVRVLEDHGPGLYGPWAFHQPRPHVRTTAFWLPRELLNAYPLWVQDGQRYEFEHGRKSITQFVTDLGLGCCMVSRTEVLPMEYWKHLSQNECLMLDQHCDRMGFKE